MKGILYITGILLFSLPLIVCGQSEKVTKDARKEARKEESQGWKSGNLKPIANQIEDYWMKSLVVDEEEWIPIYILGEGTGTDLSQNISYELAKASAINRCAMQMFMRVNQLIENKKQTLITENGEEVVEDFIARSKMVIDAHIPDYEIVRYQYRILKDRQIETLLIIDIPLKEYLAFIQQNLTNHSDPDPEATEKIIKEVFQTSDLLKQQR